MLVSVRRVETYEEEPLYAAVCQHFEALGVAAELSADTRVLLKPNLLAGRDPASAVTTHPALLGAIARWLREHGVQHITLADSPGGVYTPAALRRIYSACGLNALSSLLTLNEDVSSADKNGFLLIRPVLDADYIIDCAKLKTHGLTTMTGAVKNLFGCIPGLKKPELHCVKSTVDSFADYLLDLCETVRPNVTVLDAIDCMEGNGPGGGTVRHMGYTLASRSPYAIDEEGAALMALRPTMSPVLRHARLRKLIDPAQIERTGDELIPADPPFILPDAIAKGERFFSVNGIFHHFCGRRKTYPSVLPDVCVGCGRCAESCPKHLIQIENGKAQMQRKGCISCFCCQEMCPAHAITVRTRGRA